MRQGFDSQRMGLAGDAAPITQDVGAVRSLLLAPVSVSDNATLAYHSAGPDRKTADLWIVRRDGRVDRLIPFDGHKSSPVWSLDGSRARHI